MILNNPSVLEPGTVDDPTPDKGDVVVQVTHSGICGTDLEIYHGGIPVDYPRIMGHEMIGEVAETTEKGPAAGSRVIVDPVTFCGTCYHCKAGQTNICPNGVLIGRDRDGGFADYLTAPAGNLYVLPEEIKDKDASLIQVLTTCFHAQQRAPIAPGESVVVIGLGVTGQLHAQLAKDKGADPVIGITRSAWKRELAETLGADVTLEPGDDLQARVLELTEGRGADLVIETSGWVSSLAQAIELARIGGRILPFGIYTEKEAAFPYYQLYFKELSILNARAAKDKDYPSSIDLVEKGAVKLPPLISHMMPLDDLNKALDTLESSNAKTMKIILEN